MAAFFSGTDVSTLQEEGSDMNNFVSLIVNNAGKYCAAVTRKFTANNKIVESFSAGFFGEDGINGHKEYAETDEYLEYYPLIIEKETVIEEFDDILERLDTIRESKRRVPVTNNYTPGRIYTAVGEKETKTITPPAYNSWYDDYDANDELDYWASRNAKNNQLGLFEDTDISKNLSNQPKESTYEETYDTLAYKYKDKPYTKEVLNDVYVKLITCSPTANSHKVKLDKFEENIEEIYSKKFKDYEGFETYMESLVEYLTWYVEDPKCKNIEPSDKQALYAWLLIGIIDSKDYDNEYIDIIKEVLYRYAE